VQNAESLPGSAAGRLVLRPSARLTVCVAAATGVLAGCAPRDYSMETGYADQSRLQVQFFAPPGATVTVAGSYTRAHQIAGEGEFEHRLERSPEEFCVFNLSPGRYEFKYTTAEGLPGLSVYGELCVEHANSHEARVFMRRAFVPVSLPSEYYRRVQVAGDEIFPYRGEVYRTAIDEYDLVRLKEGDVIEKVFFIADLQEAEKRLNETSREIAVLEREIEYAEARFKLAYYDFRVDVGSASARFWGRDRAFIEWENRRQKLEQRLTSLQQRRQRTQALLDGDHVLARRGMLVLATEEVVEAHRDPVSEADRLGEVVLVMRIGGRHMHWGQPRQELASYEP